MTTFARSDPDAAVLKSYFFATLTSAVFRPAPAPLRDIHSHTSQRIRAFFVTAHLQ
jgi:hypothetical protein